jgi:hypothetical protein
MKASVHRSIDIQAPPEQVWALVSDLPGMGRYSPENTGGTWKDGQGPAVGAVFRGRNAQGRRRWSTRATVRTCDPGRAFGFRVTAAGLSVADWSYSLAPTPTGCTLTETWQDGRGFLVSRLGAIMTGVQDRDGYAAKSIEHTLARVKSVAEAAAPA